MARAPRLSPAEHRDRAWKTFRTHTLDCKKCNDAWFKGEHCNYAALCQDGEEMIRVFHMWTQDELRYPETG